MDKSLSEAEKLDRAVEALFASLTTVLEDNGNIMTTAVRDFAMITSSQVTGLSLSDVEAKVVDKGGSIEFQWQT